MGWSAPKMVKTCEMCAVEFRVKPSHFAKRKTCSKTCDGLRKKRMYTGTGNPNFGNTGEKCAVWKGGRRLSNYGYVLLHKPEHPNSRPDGYIFEHRYLMSKALGRPLRSDEIVHHIDGDKTNNDLSNLEITTLPDHTREHNKEREIVRDSLGRIRKVVIKKGG